MPRSLDSVITGLRTAPPFLSRVCHMGALVHFPWAGLDRRWVSPQAFSWLAEASEDFGLGRWEEGEVQGPGAWERSPDGALSSRRPPGVAGACPLAPASHSWDRS